MTAGSGIVHTERTPPEQRGGGEYPLHGYQIWVALPKDKEDMAPEFSYTEANDLPAWEEGNLSFKLVAGDGYGRKSPVPVHSALFMIEVRANADTTLFTGDNLKGEIGICVVEGHITACNDRIEAGNLMVSKAEDTCSVEVSKGSHLLLFGGQPFAEERFINWNFVSSSQEKINAARVRWQQRQFEMVPGETGYVPLP